ncbi:MAG: hypothetical protein HY873_12615 [Chloroflexi bacterium]|nr:hypothetical protein [Chloroflexota bacterium]
MATNIKPNHTAPPQLDEDDDGFGFETEAAEPAEQVSSVIAIIRIIAVLGMGLCLSFGLFISLVGVKGLLVGVPSMLAAIPLFFLMQWAEKWAARSSEQGTGDRGQ